MCASQLLLVVLFSSNAVGLASTATPALETAMLKVRVEPIKHRYLAGEPIGIKISLSNPISTPAEVAVDYPGFQLSDSLVVSFVAKNGSLKPRPIKPKPFGGRMPVYSVSADEGLEFDIFLQRYLMDLEPGRYRLSYRLRVPYEVDGRRRKYATRGQLEFSIVAARPGKLRGVLAKYAEKWKSTDWQQTRTAVEALCVVNDAQVVPYLAEMVKASIYREGLEALARFPKDKGAQAAMEASLESKYFSEVVQALGVVTEWRYELPIKEVKRLLKSDNEQIQQAVVKYIKTIKKSKYLDLLEP